MTSPAWLKDFPLNEIEVEAKRLGLEKELITAVIAVESAGRPYAFRYEPHYRWLLDVQKFAKMTGVSEESEEIGQKTSWGLMQIMGGVARELGFKDLLPELCRPEIGLRFGSQKLKNCLQRYPGDLESGIASYNAGTARKAENGKLVNQSYVDKVLRKYKELKVP